VTDFEGLARMQREAKALRQWCRDNRDGCIANEGAENERTITPKEVADWLDGAEDMLQEFIPRKAADIESTQQLDSMAVKVYPEIFDRKSEDYGVVRALFQSLPGLATVPARNLITGDYLLGARIRTGKLRTAPSAAQCIRPHLRNTKARTNP
jgi:hypothetical protein